MKLIKVLNETITDYSTYTKSGMVRMIKKDCRKFLKESGNLPLYRGMDHIKPFF